MNNAFKEMFERTSRRIETELRSRGELMLPGNPEFDALVAQIEVNRAQRDQWERTMSAPITNWKNVP